MIKLMKVVWSVVAIPVITVLCSDLNPAALLSQPEHPHASNGCGNDHSTDCTAVLLNLRPDFRETAPATLVQITAWRVCWKAQALLSWFHGLLTHWDGEHFWASSLMWVTVCDEAGMFLLHISSPLQEAAQPYRSVCLRKSHPKRVFGDESFEVIWREGDVYDLRGHLSEQTCVQQLVGLQQLASLEQWRTLLKAESLFSSCAPL